MSESFKVQKSEDERRAELTPELCRVAREHATERPWSHIYNTGKRDGIYRCAACEAEL